MERSKAHEPDISCPSTMNELSVELAQRLVVEEIFFFFNFHSTVYCSNSSLCILSECFTEKFDFCFCLFVVLCLIDNYLVPNEPLKSSAENIRE